ncbi:hypothetical protein KOW79_003688 [Hemibagrus wyckioides]|uniref:Uncharacterized protein n=1 Tax=Hemibagrus wyckioides TaxID=337641 RepID=A0A9D3P629_9TELE|nr:hypothetical protein KOW79_003688 [Hemibagrus wyckioides]
MLALGNFSSPEFWTLNVNGAKRPRGKEEKNRPRSVKKENPPNDTRKNRNPAVKWRIASIVTAVSWSHLITERERLC